MTYIAFFQKADADLNESIGGLGKESVQLIENVISASDGLFIGYLQQDGAGPCIDEDFSNTPTITNYASCLGISLPSITASGAGTFLKTSGADDYYESKSIGPGCKVGLAKGSDSYAFRIVYDCSDFPNSSASVESKKLRNRLVDLITNKHLAGSFEKTSEIAGGDADEGTFIIEYSL